MTDAKSLADIHAIRDLLDRYGGSGACFSSRNASLNLFDQFRHLLTPSTDSDAFLTPKWTNSGSPKGSCVDEKDWPGFRTLFTDPLDTDFSGMDSRFPAATITLDQQMASTEGVLSQFAATQHMITNAQVLLDGDRATCRATMRAEHWISGIRGNSRYTMFGKYENGFVRTAEGWKIAKLKLTVTREEGNTDVWSEAIRRAQAAAK